MTSKNEIIKFNRCYYKSIYKSVLELYSLGYNLLFTKITDIKEGDIILMLDYDKKKVNNLRVTKVDSKFRSILVDTIDIKSGKSDCYEYYKIRNSCYLGRYDK